MGYIELEQFTLDQGVTADAFGVLDDDAQAWSHAHRAELRRRTTAFGEAGTVLVLTLFGGATPPAPLGFEASADAVPLADALDALRRAMVPGSYRRSVYEDRG
jgi:hypothetical protein